MHLIYCYQNKINGKRYIGQTKDLARRHQNHLVRRKSNKGNLLVEKKIIQYGMENFSLTIIEENLSQEAANEREIHWIAFYKTNICKHGPEFGYNLCDGGLVRSGHKLSEETKRKISEAQSGSKNIKWGDSLNGRS